MTAKENEIMLNHYKSDYIENIDKALNRCNDIGLLDFIYQLLIKSEKASVN